MGQHATSQPVLGVGDYVFATCSEPIEVSCRHATPRWTIPRTPREFGKAQPLPEGGSRLTRHTHGAMRADAGWYGSYSAVTATETEQRFTKPLSLGPAE